jgi:hypothetical protein
MRRVSALRHGVLLACASVLAGCGTPTAQPPLVQGGDVVVRLHLSGVAPLQRQDEIEETARALAAEPWPGLDRPPRLRLATLPVAPPPGAMVTLRFGISAEGYVIHTQLKHLGAAVGGAPQASLGMTMLRGLPSWRFDPPMQNQQPVGYCCVLLVID